MFDVLKGGESDRRSIVVVVSPITYLMMERREMEKRDQSTTHEVCRQDLDTMENVKGGKSALY